MMSRHGRSCAALAALLVLAGAAGCSAGSPTGSKGYVVGDGSVVTYVPGHRPTAPDLSGDVLGGGHLTLSTYTGSVVVVNVWASWCPPCRKEAPELAAAASALRNDGVNFVGINIRENDPSVPLAFQRTHGISYPSLADPDATLLLAFRRIGLVPSSLPSTIVIDRTGKIAAVVVGPTTKITLVDLVHDAEKA